MLTDLLNLLRKPLNKDEYRAVGIVGVLGVLFGAALGFIAVPRWECAAMTAIFFIPGSLFAGVLSILLQRLRLEKGVDTSRVVVWKVLLLIVGVLMGLRHMIPSLLWRVVLLSVVSIVISITRTYLQRRKRGR